MDGADAREHGIDQVRAWVLGHLVAEGKATHDLETAPFTEAGPAGSKGKSFGFMRPEDYSRAETVALHIQLSPLDSMVTVSPKPLKRVDMVAP